MASIGNQYNERLQVLFQKYCLWIAKNPGLSKEVELGAKLSSYLLVSEQNNILRILFSQL